VDIIFLEEKKKKLRNEIGRCKLAYVFLAHMLLTFASFWNLGSIVYDFFFLAKLKNRNTNPHFLKPNLTSCFTALFTFSDLFDTILIALFSCWRTFQKENNKLIMFSLYLCLTKILDKWMKASTLIDNFYYNSVVTLLKKCKYT